MKENYIFTITTGRSGQETLHKIIETYSTNCISEFEAPNIKPYLPLFLGDLEKKFRRKFFETNELLGRGKVLNCYESEQYEYIDLIAKKKIKKIKKKMVFNNANYYFDISKFYARGLYKGINNILDSFSIVFLVRDPLFNMKSFMNRDKDFLKDNSLPSANSNLLKMDCSNFLKEEYYLWAWAEIYLRYKSISKLKKINKCIVIKTEDLDYPKKIQSFLSRLNITYKEIKPIKKANTNYEIGNKKTVINKLDLKILENFMLKLQTNDEDLIKALESSLEKNKSLL